jgi:hypothetical protein
VDEQSQSASLAAIDELLGLDRAEQEQAVAAPPADGRFAGSYRGYIAIPEPLLDDLVERTEAEPSAFGSFAAMGPLGSFELRRSDAPTPAALTTWPGVTTFYYAHERHLGPILEQMGIPVVPLKRDFLHAYERVISELGQL